MFIQFPDIIMIKGQIYLEELCLGKPDIRIYTFFNYMIYAKYYVLISDKNYDLT